MLSANIESIFLRLNYLADEISCPESISRPNEKPVLKSKSHLLFTDSKIPTSPFRKWKEIDSNAMSYFQSYKCHTDIVSSIEIISQKNEIICLSGSLDNTIAAYKIPKMQQILKYAGHSGAINSIKYNQKQNLVLSSSGDGSNQIWRVEDLSFLDDDSVNTENENLLKKSTSTLKTSLFSTEANYSPVKYSDWIKNASVYGMSDTTIISGYHSGFVKIFDFCNKQNQINENPAKYCTWSSPNQCMPILKLLIKSSETTDGLIYSFTRQMMKSWDLRCDTSSQMCHKFEFEKEIEDATFKDSNEIILASSDKSIKSINTLNLSTCSTIMKTGKIPLKVQICPQTQIMGILSLDKIRIFDEKLHRIGYLKMLTDLKFSTFDNKTITASASADGLVKISMIR